MPQTVSKKDNFTYIYIYIFTYIYILIIHIYIYTYKLRVKDFDGVAVENEDSKGFALHHACPILWAGIIHREVVCGFRPAGVTPANGSGR